MILCNYEHNVTGEASFLRLEFIERMTYQLRGCEGVSTVSKILQRIRCRWHTGHTASKVTVLIHRYASFAQDHAVLGVKLRQIEKRNGATRMFNVLNQVRLVSLAGALRIWEVSTIKVICSRQVSCPRSISHVCS